MNLVIFGSRCKDRMLGFGGVSGLGFREVEGLG